MKKIRKYCPKCGHPVSKSRTKGYMFQFHQCDEDSYNLEVQTQIKLVLTIQWNIY